MGDKYGPPGRSSRSAVQIPLVVLACCGAVGVVWQKTSYKIDALQQQLDAVAAQLQGMVGGAGGGTVGMDNIGEVQGLVQEHLQSQFGFQEQAELLIKVASEVHTIKKAQTAAAKNRALAPRGTYTSKCNWRVFVFFFPLPPLFTSLTHSSSSRSLSISIYLSPLPPPSFSFTSSTLMACRAAPVVAIAVAEHARVRDPAPQMSEPTTPPPPIKTIPRPSCVNNPALHYENTGQIIEECKPKLPATSDPKKGTSACIIIRVYFLV